MGATRFLAGSRSGDSLDGALEEVTEFECFDKIPVEADYTSFLCAMETTYEFQIILLSLMPT